jgi:hypothetical protein
MSVITSDFPPGKVPPGPYAKGERSPIVWVLLCAGCAGFAPLAQWPHQADLKSCQGCGTWTRELHHFRALIDSAAGCHCGTHGEPLVGDVRPTDPG